MARSTGLVVAAGGLAAANDVLFSGSDGLDPANFNWKIVPATLILALLFGGLEQLAPDFAVGLAGLTLAVVLIAPMGKSGSIIDNVVKLTGTGKSS